MLLKLNGATPENKYFLIKLLHRDDVTITLEQSVKGLAKDLGVTDHVVLSSTAYLLRYGYVSKEGYTTGIGRPLSRLTVQPKLIELLKRLSSTPSFLHHKTLIDDLLLSDVAVKKSKIKKHHPLNLSNRLLLVVLLCHADKCGVVRTLGFSELSQLTGMSKDKLKSQLTKLKDLGYIRSSVSGVTGVYLFGAVKGVYFLNLKSIRFRSNDNSGAVILSPIPSLIKEVYDISSFTKKEACDIFSRAKNICNKAKEVENDPSIPGWKKEVREREIRVMHSKFPYYKDFDDYEGVVGGVDFFNSSVSPNLIDYLQLKIGEYASFLLSNNWNDLLKSGVICCADLFDRIKSEILPSKFYRKEADDTFPSEEQKNSLYKLLFAVSVGLAQKIQMFMKPMLTELPFEPESMDYVILPTNVASTDGKFVTRRLTTVELHCKDKSDSQYGCYIVKKTYNDKGEGKIEVVVGVEKKDEADISDDDKYSYGLLTRPKPVATRWPGSTRQIS